MDGQRDRSRSPERSGGEEAPKRRSRFSDAAPTPQAVSAVAASAPAVPNMSAALQQTMSLLAARGGAAGGLSALMGAPPAAGPMLGEAPPPAGKAMGTAKRFIMEKGFGFITPDTGGDDLFIHSSNLLDGNALREGARVCFRPSYDHQKYKPIAEEVTGAYIDPSRPPPKNMPAGSAVVTSAPQARGPPPGEAPPPAGKVMGTVKRFVMEKGYGFIAPDSGGDDVFVHGNNLLDGNALREGSRICYRSAYDNVKNKPTAEEVTGAYTDNNRPIRIVTAAGGASLGAGAAAAQPAYADLQPPAHYAMPPAMHGMPPMYQPPFAMPPLDYTQLSQFAAYQPPAQFAALSPYQPPLPGSGYATQAPPYGAQPPPAA